MHRINATIFKMVGQHNVSSVKEPTVNRVVVPLAAGFEELEAVAVIDILRRAELDVHIVGVEAIMVEGSHGVTITCDYTLEECDFTTAGAVVLPGGLPGATNLAASGVLRSGLATVARAGGLVAAICAAPIVLNKCGLLEGRRATSHPSHREQMDRCEYVEDRVVVDGNIVTSRGAGTAVEFSGALVRHLVGAAAEARILSAIEHFPAPRPDR